MKHSIHYSLCLLIQTEQYPEQRYHGYLLVKAQKKSKKILESEVTYTSDDSMSISWESKGCTVTRMHP